MIVSRLVPMAIRSSGAIKTIGVHQQKRWISTSLPRLDGGRQYTYRSFSPPERKFEIWAEVAGAFMWWWIFWHLFTDYHHITVSVNSLTVIMNFREFGALTDEELGIPPDDAGDPE